MSKQHKMTDQVFVDSFPCHFESATNLASVLTLKLSGRYNWQGMLQELNAPSGLCNLANRHLRAAVKAGEISDSWKIYEVASDGETSTYYIGGK